MGQSSIAIHSYSSKFRGQLFLCARKNLFIHRTWIIKLSSIYYRFLKIAVVGS